VDACPPGKPLVEGSMGGGNPEHASLPPFIMSRLSDFPCSVSYRGSSWRLDPPLTNNRRTLGNLSQANQVARGGAWSRLSCASDGQRRRRLESSPRGFPDPARAGPWPSLDLLRQRRDIAEAAGGAGCAAELLRA